MTPYYEHAGITIYHGDYREVLTGIRGAALVCTDPPYGIGNGAAFWRRNGTEIENWDDRGQNSRVDETWRAMSSAALIPEGAYHVEFFAGSIEVENAMRLSREAGMSTWRLFYLVKTAPAPTPRPTFMSAVELALVSFVGKRPWYGGQHPDRWIGLTPNRLGIAQHPSEKPLDCIAGLVSALSPVGGLVIDPFMGSGTTLRAAKDLGRKAIGIEIEEKYCEIAANRLSQEVFQFT